MRTASLLSIAAVTLVTFLSCSSKQVENATTPRGSENLVENDRQFPTKWSILGPFHTAPLEGSIDHLLRYGGESSIRPTADQEFYSELAPEATLRWTSVGSEAAKVSVQLEDVDWGLYQEAHGIAGAFGTTYAFAKMSFDKPTTALVHVKNVRQLFINGRMYWGQSYGYSHYEIPVKFKEGENSVLLKIVSFKEPQFEFSVEAVDSPVTIGKKDLTFPDLLKSEISKGFWIGVPIVNMSDRFYPNLLVEVLLRGSVVASQSLDSSLSPLGILKVPIEVKGTDTLEGEAESFVIRVSSEQGEILSQESLNIKIKDSDEARRVTFRSGIDSSVQYFSIFPPKNFEAQKRYHALLTLHGANVEADYHITTYSQKDWAFIVAPTNRRPHGFAWQDVGRLDALEVLDLALENYPIDPSKVILTGHSMGGQGVWHIGAFHPDRFMGLAPAAGWSSFEAYFPTHLQKAKSLGQPAMLSIFARGSLDSNNPYFMRNLRELPLSITQSSRDPVVPPFHARRFFKLAKEYAMKAQLREIETDEHWCREPLINGKGYDCVDSPSDFRFIRGHQERRGFDSNEVEVHVNNLSINQDFGWLKLLAQSKVLSPTSLNAKVHDKKLEIRSSNLTDISVSKDKLKKIGNHKVVWNGKTPQQQVNKDHIVFSLRENLEDLPRKFRNSLSQYGTINSVFHKPYAIVIGTIGSESDSEELIHLARLVSNRVWATANAYIPVFLDHEMTEQKKAFFNLVLLGSGSRNSLSGKIIEENPLFRDKQFSKILQSPNHALVSVWPSPWKSDGLVLLIAGGSATAELDTAPFLPMVERQSATNLDFMITSPLAKSIGWAGLFAAGFYSNEWDIENRDFVVLGD